MRWHLYMPMCQSKMADRQNYFQSYKGAEEGILLVRVNSGRWSQVEPGAVDSKSGCFALITHYLSPCKQHSTLITHYLPPASNTPTYPSSSQPAIPTQGDSPKIRTFNLPNSTHPILFPQRTNRAGKSELQEKKGSSLRGQVRWPAVGSSASSNHQAKDVLIHLHL